MGGGSEMDGQEARPLTGKQRAFVNAYLGDAQFNATKAARQAGYAGKDHTLESVGSENLRKPEIKAAIAAYWTEKAMPAEEVTARLAEQARSTILDFIDIDEAVGPTVQEWLKKLAALQILNDETLLAEHLKELPQWDDWALNLRKARDAGKMHLVHKIGYDRAGRPTVEMYDAQAAQVHVGKIHKLFVDRQEVTGPDGAPFKVILGVDVDEV